MATIRSYTTIEQSKALAKILPLESADMCFNIANMIPLMVPYSRLGEYFDISPTPDFLIPCWSLSALLDILPTKLQIVLAINDFQDERKEKYVIGSVEHDKYDCYADNPVNACYELLLKLNEVNLL